MKTWSITAALLIATVVVCDAAQEHVRRPAVAGAFYSGDPLELAETVDQFLSQVGTPPVTERLIAMISPHAGFMYSGAVEAEVYHQLKAHPVDTVILVGPAHHVPVDGAAVYPSGVWITPLGQVQIDATVASHLVEGSPHLYADLKPHENEHSLETQLPFLQRIAPGAQIVPIVMGATSLAMAQTVGGVLAQVVQAAEDNGTAILLIASTDLSHYPELSDAYEVDAKILEAIQTLDPGQVLTTAHALFQEDRKNLVTTMCGQGAVLTVMHAAKLLGADDVITLRYANSAEAPQGTADRVVGYAALAMTGSQTNIPSQAAGEMVASSPELQAELLRMARVTLEDHYAGRSRSVAELIEFDHPAMDAPAGVFVTLKQQGKLRGCIGHIQARESLAKAVQSCALSAALKDTRFLSLTAEELPNTHIDISILTPLERVLSVADIVPGEHGVVFQNGKRGGVFLPQVWRDTGWSKEEFLRQLMSQKGKLPPEAWQWPDTRYWVFTAVEFGEKGEP